MDPQGSSPIHHPLKRVKRAGNFVGEILVLVIGIMVSFVIYDCRQNRKYAQEEAEGVRQLYHDLKTDTALIHKNLRDVAGIQDIHEAYIRTRGMHPDSVDAGTFVDEVTGILCVVPFYPNRMMLVIVLTYNLAHIYGLALERINSLRAYIHAHDVLEEGGGQIVKAIHSQQQTFHGSTTCSL